MWFLVGTGASIGPGFHSLGSGLDQYSYLSPAPTPDANRETSGGYCISVDDSRNALGSWIEGPGGAAAGAAAEDADYRGQRLGLPEQGAGALASTGRRLVGLVVDWWLCALVAYGLIAQGNLSRANDWTPVVFYVLSVLTVGTIGSTPGKRLLGMRVVRTDGSRATLGQVALRTFLLFLVIPAVIWDRDGRGMHDRLVGTVEVRM